MREAIQAEFAASSIVIMAAAVADFRAASYSEQKIKKANLSKKPGLALELIQNPDILTELCRDKGDRFIVGFAAESHDLIAQARQKIKQKGCDLLVANDISTRESGFDSNNNTVVFVSPTGQIEELPTLPKTRVAAQLLDRIGKLRGDSN
jgi:phosphopantothenoylcysteine decarboxylase/phosphopantothenate--cysteine ligase